MIKYYFIINIGRHVDMYFQKNLKIPVKLVIDKMCYNQGNGVGSHT